MTTIKKIIVTGGSGRFGCCLKNTKTNHKIFFPKKKIFNILNPNSMRKYLKKTNEKIIKSKIYRDKRGFLREIYKNRLFKDSFLFDVMSN